MLFTRHPLAALAGVYAEWAEYRRAIHTRPIDSTHGLIQVLNVATQQKTLTGNESERTPVALVCWRCLLAYLPIP
jgi:hypothetical protein